MAKDKKDTHPEAPSAAPVAPAGASTYEIRGVQYRVVATQDQGRVLELENPSRKGEDGEPLTFLWNKEEQQKIVRVGAEYKPARGRVPGAKIQRRAGATTRRKSSGPQLDAQARATLEEYLELKGGDAEEVLSALVNKHLGDEVRKARELAERRKKLPADLIDALAGASDDARRKVLELLAKG